MRTILEDECSYLYQSIISKRRIAIVRFKEPIHSELGPIYFLELSDQKPDLSQSFDHIEAYPLHGSYEDMVQKLTETEEVIKVERPHHTTHDVALPDGFIFRCTRGPLIEKIKNTEII